MCLTIIKTKIISYHLVWINYLNVLGNDNSILINFTFKKGEASVRFEMQNIISAFFFPFTYPPTHA